MRLRAIAKAGCALTIALSCLGCFAVTASAATPSPIAGYWGVDSTGTVRNDGDAPDLGDLHGVPLNAPVVGIAATPSGKGYWLAAADGGVFTFGDARFYGSAGNLHLNAPIVGIASAGNGYWLAAADGGVFTYGGARFYGSAGILQLNAPIVGIAAAPRGYWLAAADGGVFTYGPAHFYGSAGNLQLAAPIVGIAPTRVGDGYRLAASDGGVFTYGDAGFFGRSTDVPAEAIATGPFGGYVVQAASGWLSSFGTTGSCRTEALPLPLPVSTGPHFVGVAAAFDPGAGSVVGGALATVHCPYIGGVTGPFHAPARWRVDVGVDGTGRGTPCSVVVNTDSGGPLPPRLGRFEQSGSMQMRRTQMANAKVFDISVIGWNCAIVASTSFFVFQTLPFTTTRPGDTAVFSSLSPITITAHGDCTTEIRADSDGHLVEYETGSSYTMTVPGGSYWLSNRTGCTVSAG